MLLILQNNILLQQKTTILAKKTMFSFLLICFSILSINKLVESSPISNNVYLKTPQLSVSLQELEDSKMHPDISNNSNSDLEAVQNKHTKEYDAEYWRTLSHQFIDNQLKNKLNTEKAKNVILFLGDGMGLTTLAAARFLLGGAEQQLSFEKFPYVGLAKTYSVDKIVPDSACTATAYLCGVKAMEGTIGVNGKVDMSDCESGVDEKNHVHSIAKWALDKGKSAGLVTTTRVTHASPAGVYAHVADRVWENDNAVKEACNPTQSQLIKDIAFQLINGEVGQKLKVILGGGLENFVDKSKYDKGKRTDGLNLIETFKNENLRNVYVRTRNELLNVNPKTTERLLGLFQDSHLLYHLETLNTTTNIDQPTLEEMTRKAIEHLQENDKGYFLFVEGGRIDIAHHSNMARLALDETIEFSKAINTARAMTKESDTLIVVTADHSHSFSFAGYGKRDSDIFGMADSKANDEKNYSVLSYANGPNFSKSFDSKVHERVDPTTYINGSIYDQFPAAWPFEYETHGGDDVAVFASGPWSHLFSGVYEQNAIPHLMGYASCLGEGLQMCNNSP